MELLLSTIFRFFTMRIITSELGRQFVADIILQEDAITVQLKKQRNLPYRNTFFLNLIQTACYENL